MRTLIPALMGLALAVPALPAADQGGGATVETATTQPVNTVCPVCGMKVDPAQSMQITGPAGGPIAVTHCGQDTCAVAILGQPDRYARAAAADRRASDLGGTSSGIGAGDPNPGKNADTDATSDHRFDAFEYGNDPAALGTGDGSAGGKPAAREDYGPVDQDRASALRFNRPGIDAAKQRDSSAGSSAGMMPGGRVDPHSAGKPADRRDYDPIDQQRANALYFNQHQRDLEDRREKLQQGHDDYNE